MIRNKYKIITSIVFYILIFVSSGCIMTTYEKKINNSYSLQACHIMEEMTLVYSNKEGIQFDVVLPTVFAVGYNNNYIIVKQHPFNSLEENKNVTNYYIIPLNDSINYEGKKNLIGPLDEKEYYLKRRELLIPQNLIFSEVFNSLK